MKGLAEVGVHVDVHFRTRNAAGPVRKCTVTSGTGSVLRLSPEPSAAGAARATSSALDPRASTIVDVHAASDRVYGSPISSGTRGPSSRHSNEVDAPVLQLLVVQEDVSDVTRVLGRTEGRGVPWFDEELDPPHRGQRPGKGRQRAEGLTSHPATSCTGCH